MISKYNFNFIRNETVKEYRSRVRIRRVEYKNRHIEIARQKKINKIEAKINRALNIFNKVKLLNLDLHNLTDFQKNRENMMNDISKLLSIYEQELLTLTNK
jgi:hypothetical protein